MKTDFKRYRWLSRLASVLALLSLALFAISMVVIEGELRLGIAILFLVVLGFSAGMLSAAAYDNLICPKCGGRIVQPLNQSYTKENLARHRAIDKGLPVVCIQCGREVQTSNR